MKIKKVFLLIAIVAIILISISLNVYASLAPIPSKYLIIASIMTSSIIVIVMCLLLWYGSDFILKNARSW